LRYPSESNSELGTDRKDSRILLVEDNPADVGLVRRALEEHGIGGELTVFADGENAIQFIHALDTEPIACPDLVIIDLNLPRRPGSEVLECIRKSVRCGSVPVLILSSSNAQSDREVADRLGASRYVRKPLRLEEFLALGVLFKDLLEGGK
jgi:two-component system, chemotaxis family, response regulator Rcp1